MLSFKKKLCIISLDKTTKIVIYTLTKNVDKWMQLIRDYVSTRLQLLFESGISWIILVIKYIIIWICDMTLFRIFDSPNF